MFKRIKIFSVFILFFTIIIISKNANATEDSVPYIECEFFEVIFSENGIAKYKLNAPKVVRSIDTNVEFPLGGELMSYDNDGSVIFIAHSNMAFYNTEKKIWRFRGDVEIKTIKEKAQLNTEDLYWDCTEKIFYTESFIRIEKEVNSLTGEGLKANQDLSLYSVIKPSGSLHLELKNKS